MCGRNWNLLLMVIILIAILGGCKSNDSSSENINNDLSLVENSDNQEKFADPGQNTAIIDELGLMPNELDASDELGAVSDELDALPDNSEFQIGTDLGRTDVENSNESISDIEIGKNIEENMDSPVDKEKRADTSNLPLNPEISPDSASEDLDNLDTELSQKDAINPIVDANANANATENANNDEISGQFVNHLHPVNGLNNAPNVIGESIILTEDQSIVLNNLLDNDTDADGDILYISTYSQSANGGVVELLDNNALRFTPAKNYFGPDSFIYAVSDGNESSVAAIVNIMIEAVNDTPRVSGEEIYISEDETILLMGLMANDIDLDGDELEIIEFSQGLNGGVVELQEKNVLKYIPSANYHGVDSFTYSVSDGKSEAMKATVNVNIQEVNDDPLAVGEVFTMLEDKSLMLNRLLDNDTDIDSDRLSIIRFDRSENGGLIKRMNDNVLQYIPAKNFSGTDYFSYLVSDGRGGESEAVVTIVVKDVNDLPKVTDEFVETNEDESLLLSNLLKNAVDADSDKLIFLSFDQGKQAGLVELVSEDVLRYVPAKNFSGIDKINYKISDGQGVEVAGVVTIQVNEVNDLPTVVGEVVQMQEDEQITIKNVLKNDSDVDGDKLSLQSFGQSKNQGLVELVNGGSFRYVPAVNFYGIDSFKYSVSDGRGGVVTGTVIITVNEVNDTPVAKADTFFMKQGQTTELNVLANDKDMGDDVNISLVVRAKHGEIKVTDEGTLNYVPNSDYFGEDSFIYKIKDRDNEVSIATVTLNIECVLRCSQIFSISWDPSVSANIEVYKVYYGEEANQLNQVIKLKNVSSYDHLVDVKGEYFFAVSAVDAKNVESVVTETISGIF